ncbi:MAG: hypothetical protein HOV81_20405 [Kofleriaceae bacterium]|nr:hypothetical protein [Kofleriaceae bacterium]
MLQAVEGPLLKMVAVAGVTAAVAAFAMPAKHHDVVQRLVLHAPERPRALYLTAWSEGDVYVTLHDGEPRPITFQTRAFINDGCEWLATERLYPTSENRYSYSYDEEILSCDPGATPALRTPRVGYVTALPAD